jgi:hypothetical protein
MYCGFWEKKRKERTEKLIHNWRGSSKAKDVFNPRAKLGLLAIAFSPIRRLPSGGSTSASTILDFSASFRRCTGVI